jgi:single-strand DNA-binding protein
MEETRMTKDLNRVQLLGHLGADPDLRTVDTGQTLATFSVATSRRWKDASGQEQEETEWSKVVAWGRLAEICGQ